MSELSDGFCQAQSRYILGIDLGTTNCAVAFMRADDPQSGIQNFPVSQWVDVGVLEPRELLPSFHYQPLEEESRVLGGGSPIVGTLARDRGGQLHGRVISSAKSWLCHAGVDRSGPILPWQCDGGVERFSPVAVSSSYLNWIRTAWDRAHPEHPMSEQDVVLTLPASFDQVARQLTIEAAQKAGLPRVFPIEEPQAAFYAWLAKHADQWEKLVRPGQTILVCDIGGGTTDFTLIRVRESSELAAEIEQTQLSGSVTEEQSVNTLNRQRLTLHRVAVGQHLILGGDNIDLSLARLLENKLTGGTPLPAKSWDALLASCRSAKESLLGDHSPEHTTLHLPGTGARLVGSGTQVELTKQEVQNVVLEGFFPFCNLNQRPNKDAVGFREFGLPYAQDPAVTHHLAAFLWDHRQSGRTDDELDLMDDLSQARPDWILFNGGVMTSGQIARRLVEVVASWFSGQGGLPIDWAPGQLVGERLDLAVAFGAAYFGGVRRGLGVGIEAKLACSYYLQISDRPPTAVCVVPGTANPGETFRLSDSMELAVGQPVQFPVWFSNTRLNDQVGTRVELNPDEFASMPPIRTVLQVAGKKRRDRVPVVLQMELSQIGTLQLWCQSLEDAARWRLEFDIRGTTQSISERHDSSGLQSGLVDDSVELAVSVVLQRTFGNAGPALVPSKLVAELCKTLDSSRSHWTPYVLRSIWQSLMELSEGRKRGPEFESRWLNLLGFSLRPGFGMAADDWRVSETWRSVHGKLNFSTQASRTEAQILWRRIAGGFTAGQQLTVYQQIAGPLRSALDPARRSKGGGIGNSELIELLRLVGALELLPKAEKTQLGNWILPLIASANRMACRSALFWCLARLGARQPTYGPLNCVVEPQEIEAWLRVLLDKPVADPNFDLTLMQCSRLVHDRYRDVSGPCRDSVLKVLEARDVSPNYIQLVRSGGSLASEETTQIMGDSLPLGLLLCN